MSQDLEPHINLNHEHEDTIFQQSLIPDTLYRLRLSVLKDNEGHLDYSSQIFTFETLTILQNASKSITSKFGSGLSLYKIQRFGVLEEEGAGGGGGVEDGRTEDVTLEYDSETADETWEEFLKRVHGAGEDWRTE